MTLKQIAPFIFLILCFDVKASIVTVGDREWRSPSDFLTVTAGELGSVCDLVSGDCAGILGGIDVTGWKWAEREDVLSMTTNFGAHASGTYIDFTGDSAWAPAIVGAFGSTSQSNSEVRAVMRADGGIDVMVGLVADDVTIDILGGTSDIVNLSYGYGWDLMGPDSGVWLYRPSEVPLPAAAWLFGSALLALGFTGRKSTPATPA